MPLVSTKMFSLLFWHKILIPNVKCYCHELGLCMSQHTGSHKNGLNLLGEKNLNESHWPMHQIRLLEYLNENTKRIYEIGLKVKKLKDVKHIYHWYLFATSFSLFQQKHVLHCKNINILISRRFNDFNNVLIILQIRDSVKGHRKFIVTMIFPLISK